jgi:3D (Asp-Asp-Asp) domain-containing protein
MGLENLISQDAFNELSDQEKVKVISNNLGDVAVGVKGLLSAKKLMEMRAVGQDTTALEETLKPADVKVIQAGVNYIKAHPDLFKVDMLLPKKEESKPSSMLQGGGLIFAGLGLEAVTKGKEGKGLLKEGLDKIFVKEAGKVFEQVTEKFAGKEVKALKADDVLKWATMNEDEEIKKLSRKSVKVGDQIFPEVSEHGDANTQSFVVLSKNDKNVLITPIENFEKQGNTWDENVQHALNSEDSKKFVIDMSKKVPLQTSQIETDKNLLAIHTTRERSIKEIIDKGKLFGPSVAIRDIKTAGREQMPFGDYHLVINKKTVDPSKREVMMYTDDIYSPRLITNQKSLNNLKKDLDFGLDIVGGEDPAGREHLEKVQPDVAFVKRITNWLDLDKERNRITSRDNVRANYMGRSIELDMGLKNLLGKEISKEQGNSILIDLKNNGALTDGYKAQTVLEKYSTKEIDPDDAHDFVTFINNEYNNIKVEYFEGKILKPVSIKKEIDTVIVPHNAPAEILESLKNAGKRIISYDNTGLGKTLGEAFREAQEYAFGIAIVPAGLFQSKGLAKDQTVPNKNEVATSTPATKLEVPKPIEPTKRKEATATMWGSSTKRKVTPQYDRNLTLDEMKNDTEARATYYNPTDPNQTRKGTDGTVNGVKIKYGHIASSRRDIPKGTKVYVKELDKTFIVQDRLNGGYSEVKGYNHFDFAVEKGSKEEKLIAKNPKITFKIVK